MSEHRHIQISYAPHLNPPVFSMDWMEPTYIDISTQHYAEHGPSVRIFPMCATCLRYIADGALKMAAELENDRGNNVVTDEHGRYMRAATDAERQ